MAFTSPSNSHLKDVSRCNNNNNNICQSSIKRNMLPFSNRQLLLSNTKQITSFISTKSTSTTAAAITLPMHIIPKSLTAFTATITGGLFAGSLHAIAGPDHIAALLPRCCGLPWYKAARVGAVWGLGHGVSATLLGMVGFGLKRGVGIFGLGGGTGGGGSFDMLHHAGSFMELAIGMSLIVIGLLGIKEAREWESSSSTTTTTTTINDESKSLSAAAAPPVENGPSTAKSAVLFNGILHGFSWDGAPSLAPAVAIATWRGSLTFLISYALGTMAAMTLATTIIGEGTRKASKKLDRPDLPRDLSVGSSFLALVVGVVWCVLALR